MVVIGRHNDVLLYRELVRRGVSDYLIAPVGTLDVVRSICGLFSAPDAKPVGRVIAVIGAKGGVGASTIAHNIAWAVARDLQLDTVVADLDLAFGTAGPRLQPGPAAGHRRRGVLARPHRHRFHRPPAVEVHGPSEPAGGAGHARPGLRFRRARRSTRSSIRCARPCPASCSTCRTSGPDGRKRTLIGADEILVVAAPDLANLRNAKNLLDLLRAARPNDHRPSYCLNQVGVPKRPEIKPADFAKALDDQPVAVIPFEPQVFGTAANNGQMIAELSSSPPDRRDVPPARAAPDRPRGGEEVQERACSARCSTS